MSAWTDHVARWKDCQLCPLCKQRDRIVLARGQVPCDVVFIGEAPGASEDALGLPFRGPAGHLMDEIIERAVPPSVTYALTNLVACFPREAKSRGENEPERDEILACRPRLVEFVRIAQPKLIVLVGGLSRKHVYGAAMFRLDGEDWQPEWVPEGKSLGFVDIIHPAATFPPRMARVQASGAINHAVVQVKTAVEDMLQSYYGEGE